MLSDIVGHLTCPVCGSDLTLACGSVRCTAEHSFDVARHGYVNLLSGGARPGTADTAAMVEARAAFLADGHFASLAAMLAERATDDAANAATEASADAANADDAPDPQLIVDAGTGTGYYLTAALDGSPSMVGVAIDISKFAVRRAARAHPRIGAVVADLWGPLPVRSGAAHVILNVFAPRNAAEFRRILHPDGTLLVVTPTSRHLREVVRPLRLLSIDEDKAQHVDAALVGYFGLVDRVEHEMTLRLSHPAMETLARMGPSARHRSPGDIRRRLADLPDPLLVTASFTLSGYRPSQTI